MQTVAINTPRRLVIPVLSGKVPVTGGSTIIQLPVGRNGNAYKQVDLLLRVANVAATDAAIDAQLLQVLLRLNGRVIWDLLGAELMDLAGYDRAITADRGVVPLRFGQLDARTMEGEDDPSMGTLDVDSLEIELKWTGAITITDVSCLVTAMPNQPLGVYHSYRRYAPVWNGATEQIWTGLTLTDRQSLAALHIKNANVSSAVVEIGDTRVLEGDIRLFQHEQREYEKLPNTAWAHLDFTRMHRHGDALPLGGMLVAKPTFSVDPAGAVVVVAKVVESYAA